MMQLIFSGNAGEVEGIAEDIHKQLPQKSFLELFFL